MDTTLKSLSLALVLLSSLLSQIPKEVVKDYPAPQSPAEVNSLPVSSTPLWLESLIFCESSNRWDIKTWDAGSWSFSGLQFKISTFLMYQKRYGFFDKGVTEEEALRFIYDPLVQKKLVMAMFDEDRKLIPRHWKNCAKKINYWNLIL